MLVDCPHCFTAVVPKSDGTCPACQGDARAPGLDPDKISLRIVQGAVLPSVCCDCGKFTDRFVDVSRSRSDDREQGSTFVGNLFGLFASWPLSLFMLLRGIDQTRVVQTQLPQCAVCAGDGAPRPRYVDFNEVRMTFVVHRKLKDAVIAEGPPTERGSGAEPFST